MRFLVSGMKRDVAARYLHAFHEVVVCFSCSPVRYEPSIGSVPDILRHDKLIKYTAPLPAPCR